MRADGASLIDWHPDVAAALAAGRPVVALESSVLAQGLNGLGPAGLPGGGAGGGGRAHGFFQHMPHPASFANGGQFGQHISRQGVALGIAFDRGVGG